MKLFKSVPCFLLILLCSCTIIKRAENAPVKCCYFNCATLELNLKCPAGDNKIGVVDIYKGDTLIVTKDYKGTAGLISMTDLKDKLYNNEIRMYVHIPGAPWGNYYKIDLKMVDWRRLDIIHATKTER